MLKKGVYLLVLLMLGQQFYSRADEGMWLPLLIKRLNYSDMQSKGLQLTPEEIYSVNNSSLKDAIVVLNGGSCTAEMISSKGLMLTNHHCAFGVIQANSSTGDKNYLDNGFWAGSYKEELSAEGMTASYLVRMEDVTSRILDGVKNSMDEAERGKKISQAMRDLIDETEKANEGYEVKVRSFFEGNEYYMFIYETFTDVRLVAAPPSSIGKFGGDTDNWMWPRQTGDFAMLRVYAGPDGKPADYAEGNVPHQPKHHLPISMDGVKESDFAMIMGYPGSTDRYLTSYGVKLAIEKDQPAIVKIREKRLAIMKEGMNTSEAIRIKYASKYAQVSNYYKYFKGQTKGLKRLNVYGKKKAEEDAFTAWVGKDSKRQENYGSALKLVSEAYTGLDDLKLVQTYLNESVFGIEAVLMAWRSGRLHRVLSAEEVDAKALNSNIQSLRERGKGFFKDYHAPIDEKVLAALLKMYHDDIPEKYHPPIMAEIKKKYKGNFEKFAAYVAAKSVFTDEARFNAFLDKPSKKVLDKDPAYRIMNSFLTNYRQNLGPQFSEIYTKLDRGNRLYVAGMREMLPNKKFYPNANSTMRLTYGQVLDYFPRDAVYYNYYTTLKGVMEKEDPKNDEFIVPAKLRTLYEKKDYGQYGENGVMKVCFITNNDITGGNSGSPVINGKGQLIGLAFDGNWEAMSGDIAFENELQRTISVDIRYVLFIVDKFAGAGHLVDEMTLVRNTDKKSQAKAEATKAETDSAND